MQNKADGLSLLKTLRCFGWGPPPDALGCAQTRRASSRCRYEAARRRCCNKRLPCTSLMSMASSASAWAKPSATALSTAKPCSEGKIICSCAAKPLATVISGKPWNKASQAWQSGSEPHGTTVHIRKRSSAWPDNKQKQIQRSLRHDAIPQILATNVLASVCAQRERLPRARDKPIASFA